MTQALIIDQSCNLSDARIEIKMKRPGTLQWQDVILIAIHK